MAILSDDVAHLSEIDILAHIFMEITFSGMNPERQSANLEAFKKEFMEEDDPEAE